MGAPTTEPPPDKATAGEIYYWGCGGGAGELKFTTFYGRPKYYPLYASRSCPLINFDRGGSRISGKGVHIYKGVDGSLC